MPTNNKRIIRIEVTATVEVVVDEDFPVADDAIVKAATHGANDHRDGRDPFSVELFTSGAQSIVASGLARACWTHGADEYERETGHRNKHIMRRNARIAKLRAKVGEAQACHGVRVTVASNELCRYCGVAFVPDTSTDGWPRCSACQAC